MPSLGPFDMRAVVKLTGIPRGTLDAWERTGTVHASIKRDGGRGVARVWSLHDVLCLRFAQELRDHGLNLATTQAILQVAGRQRWFADDAHGIACVVGERWTEASLVAPGRIAELLRRAAQPVIVWNIDLLRARYMVDVNAWLRGNSLEDD